MSTSLWHYSKLRKWNAIRTSIWPPMSKKASSGLMNRSNFYSSQVTCHFGDWTNNYINTKKRACKCTNRVRCLEALQPSPGTGFTGKCYEETTRTIHWWNVNDTLKDFKIYSQLSSSVTAIPDIPRSNHHIPNTSTISRKLFLWGLLRLLLVLYSQLWDSQQEWDAWSNANRGLLNGKVGTP